MWSRWLPIGAAAIASALMYLSTILGSFGAILLAFLSPLPLFAIALGRGWGAGMAASLAGSAIVLFAANGLAALFQKSGMALAGALQNGDPILVAILTELLPSGQVLQCGKRRLAMQKPCCVVRNPGIGCAS